MLGRAPASVRLAMSAAAAKLTALLVLCTSAAFVASACGDDGGGTGTGGGGDGTGTASSSSTGEPTDPCAVPPAACFDAATCYATPPTGVSLREDLVPLMVRSCGLATACHGDPSSPRTDEGYQPYLGNKASEGESDVPAIHAAIVGVEAWGDPTKDVVTPGDWQQSYFMNKLDGALDQCGDLDCPGPDGCGVLMPKGLKNPLPVAERNLFRAWIAEGAQDN